MVGYYVVIMSLWRLLLPQTNEINVPLLYDKVYKNMKFSLEIEMMNLPIITSKLKHT